MARFPLRPTRYFSSNRCILRFHGYYNDHASRASTLNNRRRECTYLSLWKDPAFFLILWPDIITQSAKAAAHFMKKSFYIILKYKLLSPLRVWLLAIQLAGHSHAANGLLGRRVSERRSSSRQWWWRRFWSSYSHAVPLILPYKRKREKKKKKKKKRKRQKPLSLP